MILEMLEEHYFLYCDYLFPTKMLFSLPLLSALVLFKLD